MLQLPRHDSAKIVTQALSFQTPDRLPVFDGFWGEFETAWRQKRSPAPGERITDFYWIDLAVPVAREMFFPTRVREVGRSGGDVLKDDGWGRIVRTRPGTYFSQTVERLLNKPSDLDAIRFEPADLDIRYEGLLKTVDAHRSRGRAVFVKIGGPFIRSTFLRGETELLIDMVEDESFARSVVERVGEHLLQVGIESVRRADACDFGVWIYDDMCNVRNPMFSPRTFERVLLPVYARMIERLKAAGARWVVLHCDGNVGPLLDMVADAGIDGINPVEANAGLDAVKLIEKYYGRLFFIGGVCNTQVLPGGDEERIRRHVGAIVEAGKRGGLVIGTHSIGPDVSVESYELYREIVATAGLYGACGEGLAGA